MKRLSRYVGVSRVWPMPQQGVGPRLQFRRGRADRGAFVCVYLVLCAQNLGPDPALRSRLVAANAAPKQREAPAAGKESKDSTASEGGKKKVQAQPAQKKAKGGSADAEGKGKASASGKEGAAPPAKRHKGDKKKAGE